MRASIAVAVSILALGVMAEDFTVKVGDGGLVFNPTFVNAKVGDNIAFQFVAKNHSVTQSTFANPCSIMTTPQQGIDSGFQAVPEGSTQFPQWSFTVNNDTAPLWFFCAQTSPVNHCQMGMVFAVNPTPEKTFDLYRANAVGAAAAPSGASASASAPGASAFPSFPGPSDSAAPTPSGFGFSVPPASSTTAGTAESAGSAPSTTPSNAAVPLHGSSAGVLALAGLVAGLWL